MSALSRLSHIDFEDRCRDIAREETGLRFSAFGPGPDGGIDGRHAKGDNSTIIQCKHYIGSTFSSLKTAFQKEAKKIDGLKASRYILFTSQPLTPSRTEALAAILGDNLVDAGDIWSQEDIEDALRRYPEIEKSHLKLWLSSAAVLEKILKSGLETYSQATRTEVLEDIKVYVRNDSFDEASKKLEKEKVLIVSGPPGVGKTTLAKMISYYYLNEGWRFVAIRTLDEGFEVFDDEKPTLFFFDDFLGRIALDKQSLLQRESALSMFVKRVQTSKNARFVLTTRAHIFEEARRLSDYVDARRFQLAKYLLDVGSYTRKIRAYILFNHLAVSDLSEEHCAALLQGDWLKKIIDHRNYNPRVIASVSSDGLEDIPPEDYPLHVFNALEDPDLIWRKPFSALSMNAQNLLVTIFLSGEFGVEIDVLRDSYSELHRHVSLHYGQPTSPSDFEDALKSLESGFLSISGQSISFVNPSVRDFLKSYLVDRQFLELLPDSVRRSDVARALWGHVKDVFKQHPEILKRFALAFTGYAGRIEATPTMRKEKNQYGFWSYSVDDLSLSARIELLLEWWKSSESDLFIEKAYRLLSERTLMLVGWRDGQALPNLHWWVRNCIDEEHSLRQGILENITEKLVEVIEDGLPVDELISVVEAVNEYMEEYLPEEVEEAIDQMARYEFKETSDAIRHLDSEQNLSEHIEHLDTLAGLTGYDPDRAKEIVSERLAQFEEPDTGEYRPSISQSRSSREEAFDDNAIRSLFSNLIR